MKDIVKLRLCFRVCVLYIPAHDWVWLYNAGSIAAGGVSFGHLGKAVLTCFAGASVFCGCGWPCLSLTSAAEPGQLPTSGSMTLLLALITMYRQSAIEVRDLEFPLYQLTLAFRQKKSGRLYQRIKASLPVWNRVVYTFDSQDLAAGAGKPYHATFRVLEKCVQLPNKAWHIQWSDPVWFALMHGAWSNLDAGHSLRSGAVAAAALLLSRVQVQDERSATADRSSRIGV